MCSVLGSAYFRTYPGRSQGPRVTPVAASLPSHRVKPQPDHGKVLGLDWIGQSRHEICVGSVDSVNAQESEGTVIGPIVTNMVQVQCFCQKTVQDFWSIGQLAPALLSSQL